MHVDVPGTFLNDPRYEPLLFEGFSSMRISACRSYERHAVSVSGNVLIVVIKGEKRIYTPEKTFVGKPGDLFFLGRGSYAMSEVISPEEVVYEALIFAWNDSFLADFVRKHAICLPPQTENKRVFQIQPGTLLKASLLTYLPLLLREVPADGRLIAHKLEGMLLLLAGSDESFRAFLSLVGDATQVRFRDALEKTATPFDTVESLAQKVNLPLKAFRKTFIETFGVPPKSWLLNKRLDLARFLLIEQRLNVTQACAEAGFSSSSWFIRQFRERFGQTPKQAQNRQNPA